MMENLDDGYQSKTHTEAHIRGPYLIANGRKSRKKACGAASSRAKNGLIFFSVYQLREARRWMVYLKKKPGILHMILQ